MSQSIDYIEFLKVRPRFKATTALSVEELTDRLKLALEEHADEYEGKVRHGYAQYHATEDLHFWSPHLTVTFEQEEPEGGPTTIYGLYGPSPGTWTLFVFFYTVVGLATLVVTVIACANYSIAEPSSIVYLIPILVLVFLTGRIISYFGQKNSRHEIEKLHRFLEQALGEPVEPTDKKK